MAHKDGRGIIKYIEIFFFGAVAIMSLHILFREEKALSVLKISFASVLAAAAFLFWYTGRVYRHISALASQILRECGGLKRLLFDLRDGTKAYYEEKRRFLRRHDSVTIKIITGDKGEFAKTSDLSDEGALFRAAKEFRVGDRLDLEVYLPLFPQPISVAGKVVRAQRSDEDASLFDIGVEFLEISGQGREKLRETLEILEKKKKAGGAG